MSPRSYRLGQRQVSNEQTRARIIAAEVDEVASKKLFGDGDRFVGVKCLGEYHIRLRWL